MDFFNDSGERQAIPTDQPDSVTSPLQQPGMFERAAEQCYSTMIGPGALSPYDLFCIGALFTRAIAAVRDDVGEGARDARIGAVGAASRL